MGKSETRRVHVRVCAMWVFGGRGADAVAAAGELGADNLDEGWIHESHMNLERNGDTWKCFVG